MLGPRTLALTELCWVQSGDAGIKNPREEIDLAVVHDCFTITEMLIYEDLGFSGRGKAKEDVDAGFFTIEGGLPVNSDGGLKCFGHRIGRAACAWSTRFASSCRGRPARGR